jgi:hypothetical protein
MRVGLSWLRGCPDWGGRNANTQSTVQIEGSAWQISTAKFLEIYEASDSFQSAINLYQGDCLRDAGWVVMEAATSDDALAMCRDGVAVHVLITDIQLNTARYQAILR